MIRLVVSIGSNMQDGAVRVQTAIVWLQHQLTSVQVSHIYATVACNGIGADYFNAVLVGDYDGTLTDIEPTIKGYEIQAGRKANDTAVAIDIDIVMCDNQVLRQWDYNQRYFKIGYATING